MFFRILLCLLLFATTALAQLWRRPPEPRKAPAALAAVSPDGLTVAIARSNGGAAKRFGRVELWNSRTGELQRTITGFDGPVWSMTFSRDGRSVMTVSTEYREAKIQSSVKNRNEKVAAELKWWDTQTGEFLKKLSLGKEGITAVEVAWSPSGDVLAFVEHYFDMRLVQIPDNAAFGQPIIRPRYEAFEDLDLKLLDAATGQRKVKVEDASQSLSGHLIALFGRLEQPQFSQDGKLLAAISGEEVNVWSVDTGKKLLTIKKLVGAPSAIAFSPDSRMVAVASIKGSMPGGESEITLTELSTGKIVNKLKGKNDSIACLQFAGQGRALLIGSLQYEPEGAMGTVKMWDLHERLGRFNVHEGEAVSSLTLIPDQWAVVLQSGSDVELRDSRTWQVRYSFEPTETDESESMRRSRFLLSAKRAKAVAFSNDGTTVSAEIPGEGIRRWDPRTGGLKEQVPRDHSQALIASSSNGEFVAELREQGITVTHLGNGNSKLLPLRVTGPTAVVVLSADGRSLANADETGRIEVWDVNTAQVRKRINAGQKVSALAIDALGQLLASAQADYSISLWDLKTGALQGQLKKHENVVNALAFSPDARTLASGGDDRTVVLWDLASGKSKRTLKGHDLTVTSLAFSPDGLTLASGSGNAAVVLWNVTTGKLDRILR
jgi:WD40 repeat protein